MQESASAPASSAARANTVMSATFGDSFGITGSRVARAHGRHHRVRHLRVAAEGHPALLHVRAGDVDLEAGDARRRVADARDLGVLLDRVAAHVHDECHVVAAHARQHVPHEGVDADALEPDRVQQARGRLRDPRRRGAVARLEVEPLRDDRRRARDRSSEPLVLDAVAEGARGGEQRVLELDARRARPRGSRSRRARLASRSASRVRCAARRSRPARPRAPRRTPAPRCRRSGTSSAGPRRPGSRPRSRGRCRRRIPSRGRG